MSEKLVEIAAYSTSVEAHAARGLLEAEGIRAVLGGEQTVSVFSGIQGIGGKITLHVAESDAERAVGLLSEIVDGPPPDDSGLWVCPLCGDAVPIDAAACPACETPRPESWQVRGAAAAFRPNPDSQDVQKESPPDRTTITSDTPLEAVSWAREDEEDPPNPQLKAPGQLRRNLAVAAVALFIALFVWSLFARVWLSVIAWLTGGR